MTWYYYNQNILYHMFQATANAEVKDLDFRQAEREGWETV